VGGNREGLVGGRAFPFILLMGFVINLAGYIFLCLFLVGDPLFLSSFLSFFLSSFFMFVLRFDQTEPNIHMSLAKLVLAVIKCLFIISL
jgi:hypothetical protein